MVAISGIMEESMDNYWLNSEDIDGVHYINLLRYLMAHSDAFQLVISCNRRSVTAGSKRIIKELADDKVGGWSTTGDYSLPLTEGTTRKGLYCTTAIYQISTHSLSVLQRPGSLYSWLSPEYPEDLSFFRDGYCWFATCSHERLAWLCAEKHEVQCIQEVTNAEFLYDGPCCTEAIFRETYKLKRTGDG